MTDRRTPELDELGRRLEEARRRSHAPGRRRTRAVGIAGVAVALLVALSFTPPGRAVTGQIGELVGIVEVGGPPSEDPAVGRFEPDSGAVVLAAGESSDGFAFEIVAFGSEKRLVPRLEGGTTCVNLEWIGDPEDDGGSCYAGSPDGGAVCCESVVFPERRDGQPSDVPFAYGDVAAPTSRVVVTYRNEQGVPRDVEATVGTMDAATAARLGVEKATGRFFASLPGLAEQSGVPRGGAGLRAPASVVEVEAFADDGEAIEMGRISPIDDRTIERLRRSAGLARRADAWRDCLKTAETAKEKSACARLVARL